jgi:beta-phosphoglucomutase-like phosphatase (HAD superfamily)
MTHSRSPGLPANEAVFELPTRSYSGFIFDCDGTLADNMPLHFNAWRAAFEEHRAPFVFSWELFVRRAGKTLEATVMELNEEFGASLDADAVARSQRLAYQELFAGIGPVVQVVEFARSVFGRHPMAVASGGERATVEKTLENLGILRLFDAVVTAADVRHGKPAPDLFLLAAAKIGVPPSDCLVFEDSLLGIEAAERAGMGSVLVRSSRPL